MLLSSFFIRKPLYFLVLIFLTVTTLFFSYVNFKHADLKFLDVRQKSLRAVLQLQTPLEDISATRNITNLNADWNKFAYVQYATNTDYLCNSIMIFEQLSYLNTSANKVLLYPNYWGIPGEQDLKDIKYQKTPETTKLLQKAKEDYGVILKSVKRLEYESDDDTWKNSFTKLHIFNMTEYERIIYLDSDSYVINSMDYLFFREKEFKNASISMPVGYWEPLRDNGQSLYSSALMVIEPSTKDFDDLLNAIGSRSKNDYDMDIINNIFTGRIDTLPHRGLFMISSEFRNQNSTKYLGSSEIKWNGIKEMRTVAYIHFSEWPFPKVRTVFHTNVFFFFLMIQLTISYSHSDMLV